MQAYHPVYRPLRGGLLLRNGHLLIRPSKLARGMQETLERSGHNLDGPALSLAVRGTTDALSHGLAFRTEQAHRHCACCGQRLARLRLSGRGRVRLAALRAQRAARANRTEELA